MLTLQRFAENVQRNIAQPRALNLPLILYTAKGQSPGSGRVKHSTFYRLLKDQTGQDLIEYALMAAFIAVAAGATMPSVGENIAPFFQRLPVRLGPRRRRDRKDLGRRSVLSNSIDEKSILRRSMSPEY